MVPSRLAAAALILVAFSESAFAVTIDWVSVGDIGNPAYVEPQFGFTTGSVSSPYQIGKYEVTNSQYAEFLNAKAASDPLGLYNIAMGSGHGGITRSGVSGSYTYASIDQRENMPVNFVSFFDSARFANWLNNGQGSGDTETGAYTLLGGTAVPTNADTVSRNAGALVFLPSEAEWFKAGYYRPGGGGTSANPYWSDFPFANLPYYGNVAVLISCGAPPGGSISANCGGVGDLTNVGSYFAAPSFYGTFDQAGNVEEWNDTNLGAYGRAFHGGSFAGGGTAIGQYYSLPENEFDFGGFRLAALPEPSTTLLVVSGAIGLGAARRRRIG